MAPIATVTLYQLSRAVMAQLSDPRLRNVWLVAETSDVAVRGGHCYMELVEKNPDTGATMAKARATAWANVYCRIDGKFRAATGNPLGSGMKVMVNVTVDYHPVYGFKLSVNDIDPSYTLGDAVRRRREILERLQREGVLDMNKQLPAPVPALRVAVISARGAAGYGDFVNQLYNNSSRLKFQTRLFEAVMQGERTPATVIAALEAIAATIDCWDCVVIIRGGGATTDLEAFDDYQLALNVANFPLPVIVGIGHERDVTVLDYVAHTRVKTPTAAAEWLINAGEELLSGLRTLGAEVLRVASDRLAGSHEHLSRLGAQLAMSPDAAMQRADARLARLGAALAAAGTQLTATHRQRLSTLESNLRLLPSVRVDNARRRVDSLDAMLALLSPEATLRRGYTITRLNGRAVTSAAALRPGDTVVTSWADGTITSTITPDSI